MLAWLFFAALLSLFSGDLLSHGFGARTLICTSHGWDILQSVSRNLTTAEEPYGIRCYRTDAGIIDITSITSAARGVSNCYVKVILGNHPHADMIICTPSQRFYVPAMKGWRAVFDLELGDELLTASGATISIIDLIFVPESLEVYSLRHLVL